MNIVNVVSRLLIINSREEIILAKFNDTLLDVLRNRLELTGTKDGSSLGEGGWEAVYKWMRG